MNQLFGIGTRVKFLTTPDSGVIVEKLGAGMVMVLLDDVDMDIPAFEEDLVREELYFPHIENTKVDIKIDKKVIAKTPDTPLSIQLDFTNSGVQLAFLPIKKSSGEVEKLDILLLNDTLQDILYDIDFVQKGVIIWTKDGKLNSVQHEKLETISFDTINESPEFDISLKPIYTEGVGEEIFKTLKIKVKQFLKNNTISKPLNTEVYIFPILETFSTDNTKSKNLENYTKELLKNKQKTKQQKSNNLFDPIPDVHDYAGFVPEIDLHIELLHNNHTTLTNAEIVAIQLKNFDTYLYKAIRLGVPRVYIIHGVGKGKLKEMIHAKLKRNPDVIFFKNEYHSRYGWGATEVTIQNW